MTEAGYLLRLSDTTLKPAVMFCLPLLQPFRSVLLQYVFFLRVAL